MKDDSKDIELRIEECIKPGFLYSALLLFRQSGNFLLAALFKAGP